MGQAFKRVWSRLVRYFLAGVFAILPLVITIAVVVWVANFLEQFVGPNSFFGSRLRGIGVDYAQGASDIVAYAIGWVFVLLVVFALGVLMETGAKRIIQRMVGGVLRRVPLVGSIYSTSRQMVEMLDKKEDDAIKGMSSVFCYFGKDRGTCVLALLVSPERFRINNEDYHIVIIPTAPVPFGGGMIFIPAENVIPADLSVDGLMSIYVSMGVTAPEFLAMKSN